MNAQWSRRDFVGLVGAGLAAASLPARAQQPGTLYAYVGSWTQGPFGVGGGGGITVLAVDRASGALTELGHTGPALDNLNAGYLCLAPNGRFLYATNEVKNRDGELGAGGAVLSFAIDAADGSLTHVGTQPSMGVNPAFVSIDATGAYVLAANHGDYVPAVRVATTGGSPRLEKLYDDGTVTALPVQPDGLLGPPTDVAVLERLGGVDPVSQRSPHAHSVNFDPGNRFVLVCDKGADRVYTFRLDRASGRLMDRKVFPTRAGISPRHSAFHPRLPCVYVVHERESSIAVYRYTGDADLELVDTVATIPAAFTARNSPADIRVHPGGRFVYASNRGHDSLAIYEVDGGSGQLTSLGNVPCGGTTPRGINLDPSGRYLYAANQGSNNVAVFTVDTDTGALASTGMGAGVLKPACIQFLET